MAAISIKYVYGDTLDNSYFVASDEKGEERAVRASSILPESLRTQAATNKLSTSPEDYIAGLTKLCDTLDEFEKVTAHFGAGIDELKVVAAKNEGSSPVIATEPVPAGKVIAQPAVAAEQPMVGKAETEAHPVVKQYYGRLSGKVPADAKWAIDVNSSAAEQDALTAMAEEMQKKDEALAQKDAELKQTKDQLSNKAKEEEMGAVIKLLQELKCDAKCVEMAKKGLSTLSEKAIGVVESILASVKAAAQPQSQPKEKKEEKKEGPPAPFGAVASEQQQDGLVLQASNITTIEPEPDTSVGYGTLGKNWASIDRMKELTRT